MPSTLLDFLREDNHRFSHVLLDVDGTVCYRNDFIPGARDFLNHLREQGIPFYFLTNNAISTAEDQVRKFQALDFHVEPEQFISSHDPVADYLRDMHKTEQLFFLMGVQPDIPGVVRFTKDLEALEQCDGVLYNGGLQFDFPKTFNALVNFFSRHPERPFMVPNTDRLNPVADGVTICAGGWSRIVVDMLAERGIVKERIQFGKPLSPIYEFAHVHMGLPRDAERKRVLAVGDLLPGDICGANRYGFSSALVLTGLTSLEDAKKATGDLKPDYIFSSLG